MRQPHRPARRGMALIIVMVATVFLALAAYAYTTHMQAEYRTARAHMERAQARQAAISGVQWTLAYLDRRDDPAKQKTRERVAFLQSMEEEARESILNNRRQPWQFAIVKPILESVEGERETARRKLKQSMSRLVEREQDESSEVTRNTNWQFGLQNESAKIHIPTLLAWERANPGHVRTVLSKLPNATPALVESLAMAIGIPANASSERGSRGRRGGMVSDLSRDPLMQEGNQQLAWMWQGGDWNQNFQLDAWEQLLLERQSKSQSGSASSFRMAMNEAEAIESDAIESRGWDRYFTWHSGSRNVNRSCQPRIAINQSNLKTLHTQLLGQWPAEWANFVIAYRQFGEASLQRASGARLPSQPMLVSPAAWTPDFDRPASVSIVSLYELMDIWVEIGAGNGQRMRMKSPFSSAMGAGGDYLERYLDAVTVNPNPVLTGTIDILEAPPEVLSSIPGMKPSMVQQILAKRSTFVRGTKPATCGWLLSQGIANVATMRQIDPWISCRNDVYYAQVIGFRDTQTPLHRCTVTIDARSVPSRVIQYQEWQAWDEGFHVEDFETQDFVGDQ